MAVEAATQRLAYAAQLNLILQELGDLDDKWSYAIICQMKSTRTSSYGGRQ
jgi:hypothetical protein